MIIKQVHRLLLMAIAILLSIPGQLLVAQETDVSGATNALGFTLEDFFTAAVNFSPELRIAEETLNIGSARKRAATGRLLPQLSASANISDNTSQETGGPETDYDGERYYLQLSQILFDWREFANRKQASYLENQAEAEYYVSLSALLTDVAERYLDVLEAEDALTSIRAELNAVATQLELVQNYYDRQLVQITDLVDAQSQLAAVQAEEVRLQSELELAREILRSTSGLTAGQLHRLSEEIQIPPMEQNIQYWVQEARINSPLIQAGEYARLAAGEGVSASRGAYMPRVNLIAQGQDSNLGFDNALIRRTDSTYIGLNISIPLYAGGSNRAAVKEAISREAIADNQLRQVQLEVEERTRAAFLLVQANETQTEAARRLVESTTLSTEARQLGFELGTVNSVDVLNAIRDQFQAERDLQRTRYEHIRMLLILKRETGTLGPEDLLEVGTWLVEPEA